MNTDKSIREQFFKREEYPIWYYKKIEEIEVEDVVFNLLRETFIVELDGKKIVIAFGKNRKHEIGSFQSCDEGLDYTSYETVRKAFRYGKWFRITDEDTTEEFKEEYIRNKEEREKLELRELRIDILSGAVNSIKSISQEEKDKYIEGFQDMSDDELGKLMDSLFKKNKNI